MSVKPPGTRLPSSTLPRSNQSRDGALDPRAVDQNLRFLEQQVRRIPQVEGDKPPEVELLVGQEYQAGVLVGTMTALVKDVGGNFEGYVRFAVVEGDAEFDHTDPTDTVVWNVTDATLPYATTVNLQAKHGGLIAVAVPYRTISDPSVLQWVIRQHRYDEDFEAELTGHELAFDTDGYPLLSLTGDEDVAKHYVRMTVGDDIAGATPADPTGTGDDGTLSARVGKLRFDGAAGVANKQAAMGKIVGYKVLCENGGGIKNATIFGPYFKRRGDSKTKPPRVRVVAVRTSSTVAVDLTVDDPTKSVTAIEFRKREDGGSFSAYGTGWDRSTGTAGTNTSLTRGEDVTSSPGLDSQFAWRVTWTDEIGASQYIEDTINLARLEESSRVLRISHSQVVPRTSGDLNWSSGSTTVSPHDAAAAAEWVGAVTVPKDVHLTECRARLYRETGDDDAGVTFYAVDEDGTASLLATLASGVTGWTTASDGTLNRDVDGTEDFLIFVSLYGDAAAVNARFRFFELLYLRPSYDATY